MPEVIRAKIEGLADIKAAFEGLGTEVSTKIGVAADRKAAQEFRDVLKDTAPYDPRPKAREYGHLRENIRISRRRARRQGNIVFWVTTGHAFWGMFLELGTKKMPKHPWMLPAFDVVKERLVSVQIDELRTGIDRAAKRLARRVKKG